MRAGIAAFDALGNRCQCHPSVECYMISVALQVCDTVLLPLFDGAQVDSHCCAYLKRGLTGVFVKPLIDETEIRKQVDVLGQQLAREYADKPLTVLGVLTGSIVLVSDLIRKIDVPLQVGFVEASSYRGKTTVADELRINLDSLPQISGRDVLLVDDIFDTGRTLFALHQVIADRGPRSVKSAALLWKTGRSVVDYQPDFHCFKIPDAFVVGYGLDYNDDYRHLPFIGVLEEDDIV